MDVGRLFTHPHETFSWTITSFTLNYDYIICILYMGEGCRVKEDMRSAYKITVTFQL